VVSPDPLPPTASASSPMKTPESTEEDPDNPELAGGYDIAEWNTLILKFRVCE